MHILFEHVETFCTMKGYGLGYASEQAKEAVHHDFLHTQAQYNTKPDKELYGNRMTEAVVKYNSMHK